MLSRDSLLPFTLSIPPLVQPSSYWVEPITILKAPNPTGQLACSEEEATHLRGLLRQLDGRPTHLPQARTPTDGSGTPTLVNSRAFSCPHSGSHSLSRSGFGFALHWWAFQIARQAYLEAQTQSTASSQPKPQEKPCKPGHPLKPNFFLRLISPWEYKPPIDLVQASLARRNCKSDGTIREERSLTPSGAPAKTS